MLWDTCKAFIPTAFLVLRNRASSLSRDPIAVIYEMFVGETRENASRHLYIKCPTFATDFEVLGEPYIDEINPYYDDAEDEILDDIVDNGISNLNHNLLNYQFVTSFNSLHVHLPVIIYQCFIIDVDDIVDDIIDDDYDEHEADILPVMPTTPTRTWNEPGRRIYSDETDEVPDITDEELDDTDEVFDHTDELTDHTDEVIDHSDEVLDHTDELFDDISDLHDRTTEDITDEVVSDIDTSDLLERDITDEDSVEDSFFRVPFKRRKGRRPAALKMWKAKKMIKKLKKHMKAKLNKKGK